MFHGMDQFFRAAVCGAADVFSDGLLCMTGRLKTVRGIIADLPTASVSSAGALF